MAISKIILISLVCFISFNLNVNAENPTLSKEEELEIDEQLKQLNKPAVKTIKGNGGVIYDCVDFFKQPAFDHPLLKNHNYHYQMKPSSRPTEININENHNKHGKKEEKGLRCPTGTVPIRRTTKKDLIQSKLFAKTYSLRITPQTIEKPGLHHAVLRTKPGQRYNGGGVIMSIHNLSTIVSPQYSASQMTIKNGPDSIQVGWMVNPSLYGDSKTRLFTFFQAGGRSCFNTQCPGFVIVNTATPIDFVFNQISNRGDPAFITRFFVYRDAANGNWWLLVGTSGTEIGFWPGRIFSSLNTGLANYVEWGGEAYSPPGQPNTPMGNSFHPKGDTSFDSFMKQITTINESHKQVIATNTEVFADNKNLYSVRDWGLEGSSGHMMSFGGPFISAI